VENCQFATVAPNGTTASHVEKASSISTGITKVSPVYQFETNNNGKAIFSLSIAILLDVFAMLFLIVWRRERSKLLLE
jgi:type IV secretory pathway TrbL component